MATETTVWPGASPPARHSFAELLRAGLRAAREAGVRELWVCDPSFGDWPLGERAVCEDLHAWSRAGGRARLLAQDYAVVRQRHARFVDWRRQWSHAVEARSVPRHVQEIAPTLLWTPAWCLERVGPAPAPVLMGSEPARLLEMQQRLQELWSQGVPAFAPTTLGL